MTAEYRLDPAPPRRERVERQEPVHRLGGRQPQRQGRGRGRARRRAAARARPAPDVVHTSVLRRAIRTVEPRAGRRRPALDPGAPQLAAQRAALRRAAGQGQGRDAGGVRRGAVHAVAPLLRRAAAAAGRRRRVHRRSTTRATPACRPSCAAHRVPEGRRRRGCCRTGTTRSSRTCAAGKTVLVAAHGNSLRALVKHLDGISDADIAALNIPTGIPLLYTLDARPAADRGRRGVPGPGGRGGFDRGGQEPGQEVGPNKSFASPVPPCEPRTAAPLYGRPLIVVS